jgi:hypothetical protein
VRSFDVDADRDGRRHDSRTARVFRIRGPALGLSRSGRRQLRHQHVAQF